MKADALVKFLLDRCVAEKLQPTGKYFPDSPFPEVVRRTSHFEYVQLDSNDCYVERGPLSIRENEHRENSEKRKG